MMRTLTSLISLAALAAPALAADPVQIAPITFGEELIEKSEDFGERELARLAGFLRDDLERELADHLGENGSTLHVTILDADPNRPTMRQSSRRNLHMSSISRGGANLEAELLNTDGQVLETFSYSWHTHSLRDVYGYGTWTDAKRTFDRFARTIGDSLDESNDTGS